MSYYSAGAKAVELTDLQGGLHVKESTNDVNKKTLHDATDINITKHLSQQSTVRLKSRAEAAFRTGPYSQTGGTKNTIQGKTNMRRVWNDHARGA